MIVDINIGEDNVIFQPSLGNTFKTNDIGKEILIKIKQGKNKEEILQELMNKYEIDYDTLFIDLEDFISKLKIYGVVK